MKRQLQGIALILIGLQLTIVSLIDPWIPVIGDPGRVAIPVLAAAASAAGLILCFRSGSGK